MILFLTFDSCPRTLDFCATYSKLINKTEKVIVVGLLSVKKERANKDKGQFPPAPQV